MNSPNLAKHQLIASLQPFQLINIQFALHYSFRSRLTLNSLLNTIKHSTKKGSYFISSFVRDDIIIKRLSKAMQNDTDYNNPYIVFRNKFQSIKMKKSDFEYIRAIYQKHNLLHFDPDTMYNEHIKTNDVDDGNHGLIGIPYTYFQRDSVEGDGVDGVEEYLIPFSILCKLLYKHCSMKLIYKKTCDDIYIESSRTFPYKFGYSKGRELDTVNWTKDENDVIDTYCYALFQRS